MEYKLCALIPTYNHHAALPGIVEQLHLAELPVYIVDDGSGTDTQAALKTLKGIHLMRLPLNSGKGAALEQGFNWVATLGFTHVFQVDADGQHALEGLTDFIDLSRKNPQALLSGNPVYDASIPLGRRIGRWFTHIWVWVETLSFRIRDSMCGFRIYPLKASLGLVNRSSLGKRMDFDTEIMVRLFWEGVPVVMHPVNVCYPVGNLSNFDVFKDNWRITKMHTRLVFTMLAKLPVILARRLDYALIDQLTEEVNKADQPTVRWSKMAERGTALGIVVLAACYRLLGRTVCSFIGSPIVLYFYLAGPEQRRASQEYLKKVFQITHPEKMPTFGDGLWHFMSFFKMMLDKFSAWSGHLSLEAIECEEADEVHKIMSGSKGGVMLVSHLGCMEFCRALMNENQKKRMHILLHSKNAQRFNRVMNNFNAQSALNIIEVTAIGPETILYLKDRIDSGDWVVIAADRTPVSENPRVTRVPFLGSEAAFPQGPYILASLLQCPVYTAMSMRNGAKYKVSIHLFAEQILLQRGRKEACLEEYTKKYARYLEGYCVQYPYQWYNFFDFWA